MNARIILRQRIPERCKMVAGGQATCAVKHTLTEGDRELTLASSREWPRQKQIRAVQVAHIPNDNKTTKRLWEDCANVFVLPSTGRAKLGRVRRRLESFGRALRRGSAGRSDT